MEDHDQKGQGPDNGMIFLPKQPALTVVILIRGCVSRVRDISCSEETDLPQMSLPCCGLGRVWGGS